ncbi:F-box protein sne [Phtheirospermum japonicum]|uniref:F-box protein sne n=1 Tax=Phtheirospermum japonicum TaxID=374723 RepID=A0A830BJI5_9LAMI|nr:F-box protein sne [Phtheirospermum japonicum]
MVQVQVHELQKNGTEEKTETVNKLCIINDDADLLIEILKRIDDDRSIGVAACVCRLWRGLIARSDSLWEHLCFRRLSPPPPEGVRTVVAALGGYRRLYLVCVKPVLSRLGELRVGGGAEVDLTLSLFCVDYYERVLLGSGGDVASPPASLLFLRKAVNV